MKIKKVFFVILILIISVCLSGCSKEAPEKLNIKTTKELGYLEELVFQIILKLQKNDYITDENLLDWDKILGDAEKINMELDNIMLDLSNLKLANEKIGNLSNYTNRVLVAVNSKNEQALIGELNNLYQLIPQYLEDYETDKNEKSKKQLKAMVLNSFNYSLNGDWETAKNEVINVENKYNDMIGDNEYIQKNSYSINKIYILIQEYKTAINSENFELVRLKFIALCSEI